MKNRTPSKARRRDTVSVSLFPFLAVLICTMGVLILLLVIFTQQARLQAAEEARRKVEKEDVDVVQAREDVRGRIERLKKSREVTKKQLAEVRLKLGIVEDHERKLREKLRQLEATRSQMEQMRADGLKRKRLETELAETEANIARIKDDIAETKRQAKLQSRAFRPVIPVEGHNGTMRIPICVECRGDTVVIQPEGIVLTETDFEGPMGPGNPLAAALRAAREHMLASMGKTVADGDISRIEPYPLLLVRPEGTMSYNCVRHAMKSWGPDFGYELIDDGWKIDYGPPNPQRALAMQEAIDAARLQQIRLAAAAPRHFSGRGGGLSGTSRYTTTSRNGLVAYQGAVRKSKYRTPGERLAARRTALGGTSTSGGRYGTGSGSGGRGSYPGTGSDGFGTGGGLANNSAGAAGSALGNSLNNSLGSGNGTGGGTGLGGTGLGGTGEPGSPLLGTPGTGSPAMAGGSGSPTATNSGGGSGGGDSMLGGSGGPDLNNQASGAGGGGQADGAQTGGGQAGGGQAGGAQAGGDQTGGGQAGGAEGDCPVAGGQSGAGQSSSVRMNMGESGGQPSQGGEALEDTVVRPKGYANDVQQQGRYGSPLRPGEWVPTDPRHRPSKLKDPRADDAKRSHRASGSLAGKRGKNWALPGSAERATPLVRPIRIECRPGRLILVPETGLSGRQEVVLDTYTSDSINEFVAAVWHYMDNSWGIAGQGMYWKPILKVEVKPGAEGRFRDLQALLEGSGLRIERRK